VFNKIKPTMNWLLGTEKRTRFDYKILPREESDETAAEVKTKVFKYIERREPAAVRAQQAFKEHGRPPGLGWLEEGINNEPGEEMIYAGAESWRNVLHDSLAAAGPQGRPVPVPLALARLDIACEAMFPEPREHPARRRWTRTRSAEKDEDIWYLGARTNSDLEDISRFSRHRSVAMPAGRPA
jgi:hypothetical protein